MKSYGVFLLLFCSTLGIAQTKVGGKVTDERGQPVPQANILLLDTYDGASSDVDGNFEFLSSETGEHTLVVRFVGFHEYRLPVTLEGEPLNIVVRLKEQISELQAVTISAGSFTASDQSRRTILRAVDIATTAGATADIAGALNTLPGTQKVGESGRLFVRGGDGDETRTFIDGTAVLNAYSPSAPNAPSRGRFLPFMFKGTSFSTGGYSSEYGQALSSALVLESKDQSENSRTDIGLLSVGGDVAHTQAWTRGSVAAKLQYTNIRPYFKLINQEVDWQKPPVSIEGVSAFRQKVGKHGMVKLYGNYTNSGFSLYQHDINNESQRQLYDLDNRYRYANASYKDMLSDAWNIRSGISYTGNRDIKTMDGVSVEETETGIHAKTVFEGSVSEHAELKAGAEIISKSDEQISADGTIGFHENISAAFVESDLYASNHFVTRVGVRAEYNNLIEKVGIDPRLSLAYKAGRSGQVSLAYGRFRQSPKNEWLTMNKNLASEKAEHFILNYQHIENDRTFRVEGYYKRYDDLVKVDQSLVTNNGSGYAKGFEFFWRDNKTIQSADYWISYSFLDTKRMYANYPIRAVPAFASKHNFSVVYKHFIEKLKSQVGTTFSYASGRPYANPNHTKFNSDRTHYYADLSLNWSYLPAPYVIIYLSCTNLTGRDNIFGYAFSDVPDDSGLYKGRAIRQPAPRFLFVGIFITLSKDKSVNQLPSL
jgi:hypothetical protein